MTDLFYLCVCPHRHFFCFVFSGGQFYFLRLSFRPFFALGSVVSVPATYNTELGSLASVDADLICIFIGNVKLDLSSF